MRLNSYPSVYQLGHPAVADIFSEEVTVEEKVDGSQISFGVLDSVLHVRSKKAEILEEGGMFQAGVDVVRRLHADGKLTEGWQYRGEYLRVPHHNTLTYERTPRNHIILFDIMTGYETYAKRSIKEQAAIDLDLELVPILFTGRVESVDRLHDFLSRDSCLGREKVEGVVIKNYGRFGPDKKFLAAKYVRPDFVELNSKAWKEANPTKKDIIQSLIEGLKTKARWDKAIQHLKEQGTLESTMRDIPVLLREIQEDTEKEAKEEILEALWKHAWPQIKRAIVGGLPEHYKERLAEGAFDAKIDDL